jgi:exonuclease SbcC
MRPHRLELTAFGAFAEKASLNFDELEGLFLLHGETGAGKTTLLDAVRPGAGGAGEDPSAAL